MRVMCMPHEVPTEQEVMPIAEPGSEVEVAQLQEDAGTLSWEPYTWLTGDGDCLVKGYAFVNRFLYVLLPPDMPDYIELETEPESEPDEDDN